PRRHPRERGADHTACIQRKLFRAVIGTVAGEAFIGAIDAVQFGLSAPRFRQEGRNASIGGIVNQRRSSIPPSAFPPEGVVCIVDILVTANRSPFVGPDGRFFVLFAPFLGGQKLSTRILRRPLERRRCCVRPGSLKIRIAPRRAPSRPGFSPAPQQIPARATWPQ